MSSPEQQPPGPDGPRLFTPRRWPRFFLRPFLGSFCFYPPLPVLLALLTGLVCGPGYIPENDRSATAARPVAEPQGTGGSKSIRSYGHGYELF